jgi:hypothetical protein
MIMENYRVDVKTIVPEHPSQNRVSFALPLANSPREAMQKVSDYQRSQGFEIEILRVVWGSQLKKRWKPSDKPQIVVGV